MTNKQLEKFETTAELIANQLPEATKQEVAQLAKAALLAFGDALDDITAEDCIEIAREWPGMVLKEVK